MATLRFLGAAGTVTGSKYLVEANGKRLLIDAGLFQGKKELRLRNWQPLPVRPQDIDAAVLTHAHIDHTGYLPVLVRDGFSGPVLTTHATKDLCGLMLPDSGRLQEEEAATANALGYSKHVPARPLYTEADANLALRRLGSIPYGERRELLPGIAVTFRPAGHILGSATVQVDLQEPGRPAQRVLFSGDLGRYGAPVVPDPTQVREATALLVECTYGDREHGPITPKDALAVALLEAASRGGAVVIPSFAVGRAQELLYYLRELENERRVPILDVFVDSPMAVDATPIYARHFEEHDAEMQALLRSGARPFEPRKVHFTRAAQDSRRVNDVRQCIIIAASGMLSGGRVLHHLRHRLSNPRNTILFVGYQGEGTRGRALQEGAREIKIHGQMIPVGAAIRTVSGFSAHADWREVLRWLDGFASPPPHVFCVHGEGPGLASMKQRIEARGAGWSARIPEYLETVELA